MTRLLKRAWCRVWHWRQGLWMSPNFFSSDEAMYYVCTRCGERWER